MDEIRYKVFWSVILLVAVVFFAVVSSVVCYGVFESKIETNIPKDDINKHMQKSIFISVRDSDTQTLDTNVIVTLDPKDSMICITEIPADTKVRIAGSDQCFSDVMNIGEIEMLHQCLAQIIPLPVDYHIIIRSNDLYSENGNYAEIIKYVFSTQLWEQDELDGYISQFLALSMTDLALVKTENYAEFLEKFRGVTPLCYTLPGKRAEIGEKVFYIPDKQEIDKLVNEKIVS